MSNIQLDEGLLQSDNVAAILDKATDASDGYDDPWIAHGIVDVDRLFNANELSIQPGAKGTSQDLGASRSIAVQGRGRMGNSDLQTPTMICFGENISDEVLIPHTAATGEIENTRSEPFIGLRYFGPNTRSDLPTAGS